MTLTYPDNHKTLQQVVDPLSLVLSQKTRIQFLRAMRFLDIQPQYHLTRIEPPISQVQDTRLVEICSCKHKECPCTTDLSIEEKTKKLKEYLVYKTQGQHPIQLFVG